MMDGEDFLSEDVSNDVERYEKMLRNKTNEYFEAEALEEIIDYYIQHNKLKKAFAAVAYALHLYEAHSEFILQKAEIYMLGEKFEKAIEQLEKVENYEPFNADLHLLKGESYLNLGEFEEAFVSSYNQERFYLQHSPDGLPGEAQEN